MSSTVESFATSKNQISNYKNVPPNEEKVERVEKFIARLPLNGEGNINLYLLAVAVLDYSINASVEEIYEALLNVGGNIVFTKVKVEKGISLIKGQEERVKLQKIENLRNFLSQIIYLNGKGAKLELVKRNTVEDIKSKEQTEGEILFNDFVDFAIKNSEEIIDTCISNDEEELVVSRDLISDYFYDNFYSSSPDQNLEVSKEKQLEYRRLADKAQEINSHIEYDERGWYKIKGGKLYEYKEDVIGRVYFNVDPMFGPKLLNQLQVLLSQRVSTFQAKIPESYEDRKDNCVLYFTKQDQAVVLEIVNQIATSNQFIFRNELGKGQKKILKGIGFAQDATEGPSKDFRYYETNNDNITSFGGKLSFIFGVVFKAVIARQLDWQKDKETIKELYNKICKIHNVDPKDPAFHIQDNNFETIRNFAEQNTA